MPRANTTLVIAKPKRKGPFPKGSVPPHLAGSCIKPGEVRNPHGRPRGAMNCSKISEAYRIGLTEPLPEDVRLALGIDDEEMTWAGAIAIQQMRRAVGLTTNKTTEVKETAVMELREVTEGKIPERSELGGPGGTPLQAPALNVNFVRAKDGKKAIEVTDESNPEGSTD